MSHIETKLRAIGNSKGAIFPAEALARLHAEVGDTLYITEVPGGIKISSYDPEIAAQIDMAGKIMDKDRDILAALSKL